MAVQQLAVFWRDQQARYFTAWHFQPAPQERPLQRAQKILDVITQLSTLQIYGAALDTTPLKVIAIKPAPAQGTATRLEVSLRPASKAQVGGGQIRFSLPSPSSLLAQAVSAKSFANPQWQLLEKELIPYLCSPSGVQVSVAPDRLEKAQIASLAAESRPQPDENPLAAPIARTLEALEAAKRAYQQNQTEQLYQRRGSKQRRLELLQQLQELEQQAFSSIAQLEIAAPIVPAKPASITAPATATFLSVIKNLIPPFEQLKPAQKKEVTMSTENFLPDSSSNTSIAFLPIAPSTQEAELWKDLPQDHFLIPDFWLHRSQIRESYGLNERTYYRWLISLQSFGLKRSRPAQGNARVTLFYRPDFDQAVELAEAAKSAPRRKTSLLLSGQEKSSTKSAATPAPAQLGFIASQLSTLSNSLAEMSAQQKALSLAITRLESNLAEQRQADLNQINQQLNGLALKQQEMAAQLPQGHFVDLIAQLVNLNQLPKALQKLNTNVQKLAEPKPQSIKKTKARKAKPLSKATKSKRK